MNKRLFYEFYSLIINGETIKNVQSLNNYIIENCTVALEYVCLENTKEVKNKLTFPNWIVLKNPSRIQFDDKNYITLKKEK